MDIGAKMVKQARSNHASTASDRYIQKTSSHELLKLPDYLETNWTNWTRYCCVLCMLFSIRMTKSSAFYATFCNQDHLLRICLQVNELNTLLLVYFVLFFFCLFKRQSSALYSIFLKLIGRTRHSQQSPLYVILHLF